MRSKATNIGRPLLVAALSIVMATAAAAPAKSKPPDPSIAPDKTHEVRIKDKQVRVRLTAGHKSLSFRAAENWVISDAGKKETFEAGIYTVEISNATPARQRFHLFAKSFTPAEAEQAQAYMDSWKEKGYAPEIVVFYKRLQTDSGEFVDNRSLWISIARLDTNEQADTLKKKLEGESVWAWIVPETVQPGTGQIAFKDAGGKTVLKTPAPAQFRSGLPVEFRDINAGFWKPQRANRSYSGVFEFGVGTDGLLELYETISLEDYIAGVLPAEMPALWPTEALKAQAVAARSEVLASLGGKHALEGFDFCGCEHCRAYLGAGGRHPATDGAVNETSGIVLLSEGRIVSTVFSANCGGWTENNDAVWSSPPSPALRGVPDFPPDKNPASKGIEKYGIVKWLKSSPPAYSSVNKENFRWTRRFSARELAATVNKTCPVGDIRAIECGDRGVSGRLKWVKIVGSKKTETIRKELNIRLAFGGLPSAMFVVETKGPRKAPASFTFSGGGRGHGVGLCQDGAHGMALAGKNYLDILKHYFTHTQTVRLN